MAPQAAQRASEKTKGGVRQERRQGGGGGDEVVWRLPNQVFSSYDTGGDGVSEGVKFNLLVALEVLLAQEDVEIGRLLHRDVNLVWVFHASSRRLGGDLLCIDAFHHAESPR